MYITQSFEGKKGGEHIGKKHLLDDGLSLTYGCSTFSKFINGTPVKLPPKQSDDKVITGYNFQGLPFIIVVDGFFQGQTEIIFKFIDNSVLPILKNFMISVVQSDEPFELIRTMVKQIAEARAEHAYKADFTMSIFNSYEKQGVIYGAGFGVGDTAIVCKKVDNTVVQLVHHTRVDKFKDAFTGNNDLKRDYNLDAALNRNNVFHVPLNARDEIVGYTYLPDSMEGVTKTFSSAHLSESIKCEQTIEQLALDATQLTDAPTFFEQILLGITSHNEINRSNAEAKQLTCHFGDDTTLARIVIPDPDKKIEIKRRVLMKIVETALSQYSSRTSVFERNVIGPLLHFFGTDTNHLAARKILGLIHSGCEEKEIIQRTFDLFTHSSDAPHSFKRYLLEELTGKTLITGKVSAQQFKEYRNHLDLKTILGVNVASKEDVAIPTLS